MEKHACLYEISTKAFSDRVKKQRYIANCRRQLSCVGEVSKATQLNSTRQVCATGDGGERCAEPGEVRRCQTVRKDGLCKHIQHNTEQAAT